MINGNVIHDTGFAFEGSAAISVSGICDSEISGNEIYNVGDVAINSDEESENVIITGNNIQ